jgi:hypothetical protein
LWCASIRSSLIVDRMRSRTVGTASSLTATPPRRVYRPFTALDLVRSIMKPASSLVDVGPQGIEP